MLASYQIYWTTILLMDKDNSMCTESSRTIQKQGDTINGCFGSFSASNTWFLLILSILKGVTEPLNPKLSYKDPNLHLLSNNNHHFMANLHQLSWLCCVRLGLHSALHAR